MFSKGRWTNAVTLLILLITMHGFSQTWQFDSRFHLAGAVDNNVFESVSKQQSDLTCRLAGHVTAKGQLFKPLVMAFRYQGGLEAYTHYSLETRMIHAVGTTLELPLNPKINTGIALYGRFKTFISVVRGYSLYNVNPYVQFHLQDGMSLRLQYEYSDFLYMGSAPFDNNFNGAAIQWQYRLSSRLKVNASFRWGEYTFQQKAYAYSPEDTLNGCLACKESQRTDDFQEISTAVEYYHWALFRGELGLQTNQSNSFGFTFNRAVFHGLFAKALPAGITLTAHWTWQVKHYEDNLDLILMVKPDSENEENNSSLLTLSKRLSHALECQFQYGFFRNESPWRNRYYEKSRILMTLIYRR